MFFPMSPRVKPPLLLYVVGRLARGGDRPIAIEGDEGVEVALPLDHVDEGPDQILTLASRARKNSSRNWEVG